MSLTPDVFFVGDNVCSGCNAPMFANDIGIVYRPRVKKDFMFCRSCATAMTMSIAQDISRLAKGLPDTAFSHYNNFKVPNAVSINIRRHAEALSKLAAQMQAHADSFEPTREL